MRLTFKELQGVVSKRYQVSASESAETVKACNFINLDLKSIGEFNEYLDYLEREGE